MPEMTVDELIASLGKPKYTPPVNPEDWGGGGVRGFDSKAIQAAPAPDRESAYVPNAQEAIRGTQGADRLPPPPPDYQIPATGQPGASDANPEHLRHRSLPVMFRVCSPGHLGSTG